MHSNHTPPLAVSVPEAARLLGLSRSTVYNLIGDGRLRSVQIGKRRLILRESLNDLLREAGADG